MISINISKALFIKNFIFELITQRDFTIYAHLMNSNIVKILIKNEINYII